MNVVVAVARNKVVVGLVAAGILVGAGGLALAAPTGGSRPVAQQGHPLLPMNPEAFFSIGSPVRVLDTRGGGPNNGPIGVATVGPLGANAQLDLQLEDPEQNLSFFGVLGARSVVLNVTIDSDATAPSFVTVWPAGEPRPLASANNATPGQVSANTVVVSLGMTGAVSFYNQAGAVNLIVDLLGYTALLRPSEATTPGWVYTTNATATGSGIPIGSASTLVAGPLNAPLGLSNATLTLELVTPEATPGDLFQTDCHLQEGDVVLTDESHQEVRLTYASPTTGAATTPVTMNAVVFVTTNVSAWCTVTSGTPAVPTTETQARNVHLTLTQLGRNLGP